MSKGQCKSKFNNRCNYAKSNFIGLYRYKDLYKNANLHILLYFKNCVIQEFPSWVFDR